jgi:carbamoyltransferase
MSHGRLVLAPQSVFHESSVALVDPDGPTLLGYAEEERFTRVKKAKRAAVGNAHQLPVEAIRSCLDAAGVGWDDIGVVAYPYDPARRRPVNGDDVIPGDWGSVRGEVLFQASLGKIPAVLSELAGRDMTGRLRWLPHHDGGHAASAFYPSPYDRAAILTVDGIGELTTTWLGRGYGHQLTRLAELTYPHSLGFLAERLSMYLGLDQFEGPGQAMGLAAWGDPERYAAEIGKILLAEEDGFRIDNSWTRFRAIADRLADLFGPRYPERAPLDRRAADVAAAWQAATEKVLLNLAVRLRERTGETALCLAGGVALNAVAMGRIVREAGYERVYVQPAAGDAGTCLGAALTVVHGELGVTDRWEMRHPYLGRAYSDAEIRAAISQAGLTATRPDDPPGHVARLLADGQVVGWFQGAEEAGPRALGNRSLLADPRDPLMRTRVNFAKQRAEWRPYSGSFLAEPAADWIDLSGARSPSHQTMNLTHPVRPDKRALIPAIVHADGHTRAQVVTAEQNPGYHDLLRRFYRLTGVPAVLNTSLNGPGEPIVGSPTDALRLFRRAAGGIDALAVGDYLLRHGDEGGTR